MAKWLPAVPTIVAAGKVEIGEVRVVDEDKTAAHVAPHDHFLAVEGRKL